MKNSMEYDFYRVSADINLDALRTNILNISKQFNNTKICLVVKADAYGHGAVQIAKNVADIADFFAVATIDEAMELRNNGIDLPVLVLGFVHPSHFDTAIKNNISLTIIDYDSAVLLNDSAVRNKKKAKVHIKIDTGMNRIGFKPNADNYSVIESVAKLDYLTMEGIFTHLFSADDSNTICAEHQISLFKSACAELKLRGVSFEIRHCYNSAASVRIPSDDFDMIRLGIVIYGMYPSEYVSQQFLLPVLSMKSHIAMIKTIFPGETVGYGATWTALRETKIATISAGYADGYSRMLSNKGYVLINGEKAPVIGNVCMDQFMVDVTEINDVSLEDEVILIGKSGTQCISMENLASLCGTINYELTCNISKRVRRKYIKDGRYID